MMALILYGDRHWESPYVFSCFVALLEKQIPFEVKEIGLDRGEHREPGYAKKTTLARVPAVEHEGYTLAESQAILEYLEEAFPEAPRLLPDDIRERARARMVLGWLRSDLLALRQERSTTTMFFAEHRTNRPLSRDARAAADRLLTIADRLIPEGCTQLFATWSIADADLAFMLHRLIVNGDHVPSRIRTYAQANWGRSSVQSYVQHPRPAYAPH